MAKWTFFIFLLFGFSTRGNATPNLDSTTFTIRLKPKQIVVLSYFDSQYESKKILFNNPYNETREISQSILFTKNTEIRHYASRGSVNKRIHISQNFYIDGAKQINWTFTDDFRLVPTKDSPSIENIELLDSVDIAIAYRTVTFKDVAELSNYFDKIKVNLKKKTDSLELLYRANKVTGTQKEIWKAVIECKYYSLFFNAINYNPKLKEQVKDRIDLEISNFKAKLPTYESIRFDGLLSVGYAILYYIADKNYVANFDKVANFSVENYGEIAVPILIGIMKTMPQITEKKYEASVNLIKGYATPYQKELISILTNSDIPNPAGYFLNTMDKNRNATLNDILKKYAGNIIVLDFWASWCIPCRMEIPALKKAREKFKDKKIALVSISIDEDNKMVDWRKALTDEGLLSDQDQYRIINPKNSPMMQLFYLATLPRYVVLDKTGKILDKNFSRPSESDFETKLLDYLKKN